MPDRAAPFRLRQTEGALWRALMFALLVAAAPVQAQETDHTGDDEAPDAEAAAGVARLPAPRVTEHAITIDGRALAFEATAGAITLTGGDDRPEADIAYVAYTLESDDDAARPVTFAVNGGPGAASAYLHIGAIGPWLLPLDADGIRPAQPVELVDNAETWLAFTDLVFIDPVGTGFSRLVGADDRTRSRYLSIDGDIEALADAIRRWLTESGRIGAPVYFVGESYGGFRGPLLAEALATEHGVALSGMTLVSPVLDFGWWQQPGHSPLPLVSLLPSLAASAQEAEGWFDAAAIAEAEAYAAGDYVADLLRGLEDPEAVGRVVERVAALTGLDRETVARAAGRIDGGRFAAEILADEGRFVSVYDATIAADDPFPEDRYARTAEPVLDALTAPLTRAMLGLYGERLDWLPERRYRLLNRGVNRGWDWGGGRGQPEAVSALRRVMGLDPALRLLVVHGYADLVTPYFASELILRQLDPSGVDGRVRRATYRGGHMFYIRDDSRRALRDDARVLYEGASAIRG